MSGTEEDSVDIVFHGAAYNLAITATEGAGGSPPSNGFSASVVVGSSAGGGGGEGGALTVDLEELATGAAWHGEFSASYIENITSKTGSFKRFPIFVKMLMGALRQQTETVFLDLLTYSDLVR